MTAVPLSPVRISEMLDYATVYGAVDENTPNGPIGDKAAGDPMDDVRRGAIWAYKRVLGLIGEDVPPPQPQRFVTPGSAVPPDIAELLIILLEEHAEVIQRTTKALRFGLDEVQPGQHYTNAQRITEELGDSAAVVTTLIQRDILSVGELHQAELRKYDRLRKFLQNGTV